MTTGVLVPFRGAARWCVMSYLVLTIVDVIAEGLALPLVPYLLLVIMMPLLWVAVRLTARPTSVRRTVLIALTFAWFGDVLGFSVLAKIIFFVIAQIAYCVVFWPVRRKSLIARRAPLAVFGVIMSAVVILLASRAESLIVPVIIYGVLLSVMVALATGVNRLAAAGAVVFLISDIALGALFFAVPGNPPWLNALIMGTYFSAQVMIVTGVLRHLQAAQ